MTPVFLIHLCATWMAVGLIWTVQLISYPLFQLVGAERFPEYHARHMRNTGWLVAPIMATEAISAAWLLFIGWRELAFLGSVVCLAGVWGSTALIQVPMHLALGCGFDSETIRKLIRSNWLRTGLWSVRGVLLLLLVSKTS